MEKYIPGLFKFALFPNYNESIKYLAEELAAKEEWDFSGTEKKHAILKNYLDYTYRQLSQEKKIVYTTNNEYAAFNTGLITENLEEIFAFFEKYNKPDRNIGVPFCFKAFLRISDNHILRNFSPNFPELANYFEKPELLIFNPKCTLIPDIDHILEDNKDRFPEHLKRADPAELRRQLIGAIDEIRKKVKTNYKLAIPQEYKGKIQLLLPLCLTPGSPNPDLALVVHRLDANTYSARTCLTLRMAYVNARLIVKPQSEWLKP